MLWMYWMFETRCLCLCLPLFGKISIWILDAEFRNIEQILVYWQIDNVHWLWLPENSHHRDITGNVIDWGVGISQWIWWGRFMKYSDGDGMLATSIAIFFGAFSSFLDLDTVKLGRRWMKFFLSLVLDLTWRMAPLRVLQSSNFLPVVLFSSKMARVCN